MNSQHKNILKEYEQLVDESIRYWKRVKEDYLDCFRFVEIKELLKKRKKILTKKL